jgi:hypothetical protein
LIEFEPDEEDLKEIRSAANGRFALGNQRFKDEISAMLRQARRAAETTAPAARFAFGLVSDWGRVIGVPRPS